jgi:hypothetical protein
MQDGKFKAKPIDGSLEVTKNGNLIVRVVFKTESDETVDWVGSLSTDKSQDFVLEQLSRLGWKGKSVEALANLTGMDLDCTKEFELIIENVTTDRGATFTNVKYINEIKADIPTDDKLARLKALGLGNKLSGQKVSVSSGQNVTTKKVSSESLHKTDPRREELPF